MPPPQALAIAKQKGLDLVEISPTAVPPVCRIRDLEIPVPGAEAALAGRSAKVIGSKRSSSPKVDEHDYQFRRRNRALLEEGERSKRRSFTRPREAHPESAGASSSGGKELSEWQPNRARMEGNRGTPSEPAAPTGGKAKAAAAAAR